MAQKFTVPITIKQLASAGSDALTVFVNGETYGRIKVEAGGRIAWSDGLGVYDTNLYRDGVNTLATDDVLKAIAGVVTMSVEGVPTAALPDGAIAVDTLNDTFYFRSSGAWTEVLGGGASLTVSDSIPTEDLAEGNLWYESDTGKTFVYYDSFWVEIGKSGQVGIGSGVTEDFSVGGDLTVEGDVIVNGTIDLPAVAATEEPASPINGQLWFDPSGDSLYVYYGGDWILMATGG